MTKNMTHDGKRSWWDGSVTTACGQKWPKGQGQHLWFVSVNCPICLAIRKRGKR
ncbi:hypothetical protein ACFQV2_40385 [Actinokineospora soli]|uniref:Zinc-ribbon domain-containing protein n=1 Tax=Actinokineospora soli TaxID=1048753 RepID=A0ABW2TG83_9PSEU